MSASPAIEPLARNHALVLRVPTCDPGIGTVIRTPESDDLIQGVEIEPLAIWPDDRG